jgi:hypothetical protein
MGSAARKVQLNARAFFMIVKEFRCYSNKNASRSWNLGVFAFPGCAEGRAERVQLNASARQVRAVSAAQAAAMGNPPSAARPF